MADKSDHDMLITIHTDVNYIKTKISDHCKKIDRLDNRIDKLESWKDKVHIVFLGLGAGIGSTWAKLTKMF